MLYVWRLDQPPKLVLYVVLSHCGIIELVDGAYLRRDSDTTGMLLRFQGSFEYGSSGCWNIVSKQPRNVFNHQRLTFHGRNSIFPRKRVLHTYAEAGAHDLGPLNLGNNGSRPVKAYVDARSAEIPVSERGIQIHLENAA